MGDNWYNLSITEVCSGLNSSVFGISSSFAKESLERYGKNTIQNETKVNTFKIFIRQFKDFFVLLLFLAFVLSFSLGEYVNASLILFFILFDAVLGFIQDYKAEKSLEALDKLMSLKSIVIRDKIKVEIDSKEIVPGDVVLLESGSIIPADLRIIECSNLEVDESILTGESVSKEKNSQIVLGSKIIADQNNMLFCGCVVTKGTCKGIVVSTAFKTEIGKISKGLSQIKEIQTPLQKGLNKFGRQIGIAVIMICICVFILNSLRGFDVIASLLVAISLAVAAVPESLPAVVAIMLSLGVSRMAKNNALVRKLSAVETLGCTTVICTDKTGTLTKNEMTVKNIFVSNKDIFVTGDGYDCKGDFLYKNKKIKSDDLKKILEIGTLCNNSKIDFDTQKIIGDPTEVSLLVSAKKYGIDNSNNSKRIFEIPFDSERKMMTSVHKTKEGIFIATKGAPGVVLCSCSKILINGKVQKLTPKLKKIIEKKNDEYTTKAFRVLAFAYKETKSNISKLNKKYFEKELIYAGLSAMMDPPRLEVKEMIEQAKEAGIKVVMITGDNINTAKAIGKMVGITGLAVSGDELSKLSDDKLLKKIEYISIYARVSPSDKLRIVSLLQKKGHTVSMTGDGVNDALALKKSDIGVAMGIRGCDVAKDSASMVLVDDSFKAIVLAIREGRRIFDNIRKAITYLLSANIVEIMVVFLCAIVGLPVPLTAVQLLFINIFTDGAPVLTISLDNESKEIMKRKPRPKNEGVIDEKLKVVIFFIAIISTICMMSLYFFSDPFNHYARAQTVIFAALIIFEMAKIYVVRKLYGLSLFSNKPLFFAMGSSILGLLALLYIPVLSGWFKIVPLGFELLWILLALIFFLLFVEIFLFFVKRHYGMLEK